MILYKSTRGASRQYKFSQVLLQGIASDGGLFVPDRIPRFNLKSLILLIGKSYQHYVSFVFDLFETGFSSSKLKKIIQLSYSADFDDKKITPLFRLKDSWFILELWHGPTMSFKDIALQLMPKIFKSVISKQKYLILVATSGDTGKAALSGFKDLDNIHILVVYPQNGVSQIQKKSMVTQKGDNIKVLGISSNFDSAQTAVKRVFNDGQFRKLLEKKYQFRLSSANSINWGRILPQIVYYLYSYNELVREKIIVPGDKIDVAVPTGNFGNILAAFYAKKMGLPVNKLICASNSNNVLSEFLTTGKYDLRRKKLIKTPSPSMDILISGNLERFLYELTGDSRLITSWMRDLQYKKHFKVGKKTLSKIKNHFFAGWVSNGKSLSNIKKVFKENNYLVDPHTSVVLKVVQNYQKACPLKHPVIICSTAHWSKFPASVYFALRGINTKSRMSDEFKIVSKIQKIAVNSTLPPAFKNIAQGKKRFISSIKPSKNAIQGVIIDYLNKINGKSGSDIS